MIKFIFEQYGKWAVPITLIPLLTVFLFAYQNTKPGEYVRLVGIDLIKIPLKTISITIHHQIEETGDPEESEAITVSINGITATSVLSKKKPNNIVSTINITFPQSQDPYVYSVTGSHTRKTGVIPIKGSGKLSFKNNRIYKFSSQDAATGLGWEYSLVEL